MEQFPRRGEVKKNASPSNFTPSDGELLLSAHRFTIVTHVTSSVWCACDSAGRRDMALKFRIRRNDGRRDDGNGAYVGGTKSANV